MSKIYKKISIIFVMAFAIVLGCFNNALAADSTNYVPKKDYSANLLANYKFDETIGTTCVDSKGAYNGIYNGTTSVTDISQGTSNTYRRFNINQNNYIEFNNPVIPKGKKSIKFKIRTTTKPTNASDFMEVFDNCKTDIAKNGMYCTIDLKGTLGIGGVDSSGDWNNMNYIIGVPNVADGDWHTILFTWDGTTNANSIKMYKDNLIQPVAQVTPKREDKDPTEKLAFGKKVAPNTPYFNGDLDEIEIYNDVVEYGVKSTGISLDKTSTNLTVGQTDSLTATITPDNATNKNMKWVSSDPNIVTVDENGKVTAVKEGTTTVSAITMDGSNLNASCIVTVKKVDTPEPPTNNNGNAILTLTMTNGNIKLYTVSMTKVNDFISWYNNRASGSSGNAYYSFDKTDSLQPFTKKTEYVVFDKISSFEVDEYSK